MCYENEEVLWNMEYLFRTVYMQRFCRFGNRFNSYHYMYMFPYVSQRFHSVSWYPFYRGVSLWDSLPKQLQKEKSRKSFKNIIKISISLVDIDIT